MVGFSGSRFISSEVKKQVSQLAISFSLQGHSIAVGCATGTDQAVRKAVPEAQVFQVQGHKPWQLAKRSQALVQAVAGSLGYRVLVGFPSQPCPAGLLPSASFNNCFSGHGSGTWGTLAYAKGLGVPVFIFWAGYGAFQLPQAWGQWSCKKGSGILSGAWSPQSMSYSLF